MRKQLYILLLGILGLAACTEPIDLDLNTDDNVRLVVDAMLTTAAKPHLVKLTETRDYFVEGEPNTVSNAEVTISDGTTMETLTEQEPGHYYTSSDYAGEVGKTYTLTIQSGGETYTSVSEIVSVAPLDGIRFVQDFSGDDERCLLAKKPLTTS